MRASLPLVLLAISIDFSVAHADQGLWVKPPAPGVLANTPGLVHQTMDSAVMKTKVGYCVVLPPNYHNSDQRYPVVYWLHGGGGNESSSLFTARAWRELGPMGLADDVILVYPNGYRSGYMDHHDGSVMVESMIIDELIPHIDRQFRTIAERAGRAVHGFSMGASGSLKFVMKHPELFCSAVAYGGGAIDLSASKNPFILNILERNLKSDPKLIRKNNSYHFLEKNSDIVRRLGTKVLLICGEADPWMLSAQQWQRALQEKDISCRLLSVPGVGHNLRGLSEAKGNAAAMFQDRVFQQQREAAEHPAERAPVVTESYYSTAERRKQTFQLILPPAYSPERAYPLFVQMYGSPAMLPTKDRPYIRLRPNSRGVWGFRSMSRYDILQCIEQTKLLYNIDESRVYMTGTSAGATGVMHAAAQRVDVFAGVVPLVAFGNDLPLKNFRNLPLRCEHGVNDWTSAICNVRVQFQKLAALGYDAVLNEHPRAGHGVRTPPPATMDWLFQQRNNGQPQRVVYCCEHPDEGRAYWITMKSFVDPHQIATIEATVRNDLLHVETNNLREFEIDKFNEALAKVASIEIGGQRLAVPEGRGRRLRLKLAADATDGVQSWLLGPPKAKPKQRPYGAGAAAHLFQGEPLLVVYGTQANGKAENAFLKKAAAALARSGGPQHKPASVGFGIRADKDLTPREIQEHNLLLVGTPENHSWLKQIASDLPYEVDEQRRLRAGDRKPLQLNESVLSLHYFNPQQPQRTIYVVSPYLAESRQADFFANPRKFLAGSDAFKRIDQPDLMVRGVDHQMRREMQFDAQWNWLPIEGAEQLAPAAFTERVHLAHAHMKVMKQDSTADFALWWGPEDQGMFGGYDFNWLPTLDPSSYSMADYLVRRRSVETMVGELPGNELREIHSRWIANEELVSWPAINAAEIDQQRIYRIVIPMDLVPKLGNRHKVLSNVAAGPEVMPRQVAQHVFAAEKAER